jgi:nucleotidyltransferase substrate binding protein (TIGR01987 family)
MVSREGLQNHFARLEKAYFKLKESLAQEYNEFIRDSVIKRFELVFELLWKLIKRLAEAELLECYSPKSSFQAGFQMGLLQDEAAFLKILEYRNLTVHTYDEGRADQVYDYIVQEGASVLEGVIRAIANKMGMQTS